MHYKKVLNIFILLLIILLTGCSKIKEKTISNYTFSTNEYACVGIYEGQTFKGIPHGYGVFKTSEAPDGAFSCSGKWEYGKLNGKGIINYENGVVMKGQLVDNLFDGKVISVLPDGSYYESNYDKGVAYGVIYYYDDKGSLIDKDWYYDGVPINSLIEYVVDPTYSDLKNKLYSYINDIVKVEGIVTEVEEKESSVILHIENNNNIYYVSYDNVDFNKLKQCIAPQISINDNVSFYGYYDGVGTIGVPQFKGIVGYINGEFENNDLSYNYDDLKANPYYYAWEKCDLIGDVSYISKKNNNYYYLLIDSDDNKYYLRTSYKLQNINKKDLMISGIYYGCYKILNVETGAYDSYPLVFIE